MKKTAVLLYPQFSEYELTVALSILMQGKKYTVGMTEENRKKTGVFEPENYSEEPVVRDGNLITARGREFIQFGTVLGQALNLSFDRQWYKGRA
ncbi:type 1 glutamine amidotransferase family protein [Paenibacillus durus]|uniref:hypothetical protein n=1 Tax=Paenibacillus durus TaxID=44251 RepID=UPI00069343E1|nr:hypothetical protein [Paenibacillus durus]